MAWSSVGNAGSNALKSGATFIQVAVVNDCAAGSVVVVAVAVDNAATTDGDLGDVTSVTDSQGNTYTKARQRTNGQGAAAAGACAAIYVSRLTTALMVAAFDVITANFNGTVTARCITAWRFGVAAGSTVSVAGGADGTPEDAAAPSATISGLTSQEYLWVSCIAVEGPSGDAFTGDADYTPMTRVGTTGGTANTNMTVDGEFRVFTGTTDTNGPTAMGTVRDVAQVYVALLESSGDTITAQVYM